MCAWTVTVMCLGHSYRIWIKWYVESWVLTVFFNCQYCIELSVMMIRRMINWKVIWQEAVLATIFLEGLEQNYKKNLFCRFLNCLGYSYRIWIKLHVESWVLTAFFNCQYCIELSVTMIRRMINWKVIWQEAVLATVFLEGLEQNYIKKIVLPVFELRFESETSPILRTIVTHHATKLFSKTYLF